VADHAGSPDGGELLFAGDVYCDLVFAGVAAPEIGTEVFADGFAVTPGGVANRAVAAARAGAHTRLLSRLGDDPLGRHVHGLLDAEPELDTSWLASVPGHQSPVTISLAGGGDRSFITYMEERGPHELPAGNGGFAATHVGIAHEVQAWVADLRAAGTTIVGGVGWDATGQWSRAVIDRLAGIDVFVANDVEATRYTRTEDPATAAKNLAEHVPLAIVTCGARGVIAADAERGDVVAVPTVEVDVVDPTGAGDVFVATFMAARYGTHRDWDLETQLRFAGLAASVSVTGLGGAISAPRRADLLAFLAREDPAGDWTFLTETKGLS
jgi:sugar/nucleoside kinase (ribokinase family)